jgi:predicted GTPase
MTQAARKPNLSLRYEDAISKMVAFVGETDSIRPLVRRQEEFLDTLSALSVQRKNLEGALLIVILGGTGVGKSMLINALAGEEIATVSAIRPCPARLRQHARSQPPQTPNGFESG